MRQNSDIDEVRLINGVDDFLENSNAFSTLTESERVLLRQIGQTLYFQKDEMVYPEGASGDSIYFLVSGTIKVSCSGTILEYVNDSGRAFGESGFIEQCPRSATLTSVDDSEFLVFKSEDLWRFIHEFPQAGIKILTQLALGSAKKLQMSAKRFVDRMKKSPYSSYHQDLSKLNQPIEGTLFAFDLKKSEILMREQKSDFDSSEVMTQAIFPLRLLMSSLDGIEIIQQGDGVKVFFPVTQFDPSYILETVLPKFMNTKRDVERLFKADGISPPGWSMNYRMIVCYGSLIPTIHTLKGVEHPSWKETQSLLFTEAARFEEIEKTKLNPEKDESIAVFSSTFASKVKTTNPDYPSEKLGSREWAEGKHGVTWQFWVYYPEEEKFARILKVA